MSGNTEAHQGRLSNSRLVAGEDPFCVSLLPTTNGQLLSTEKLTDPGTPPFHGWTLVARWAVISTSGGSSWKSKQSVCIS